MNPMDMTWEQYLEYCVKNAEFIFVRGKLPATGEWGNVPLSEIRFAEGVDLVRTWFEMRHMPYLEIKVE